MNSANPVLTPYFIAGPTAVGKSEVALWLAERIGGEIITVDSMQVYRGLDIGTAKPTAEERARVPHHLLDVCDLTEAFDAAQFIRHAEKDVAEIQGRGRTPIFCGGTGLYFQAYWHGLGQSPATEPAVRAPLEATPLADLLRELQALDPIAYEQIDRQNPRRVVRALEVIRLTGKPFSEQRSAWETENSKLKIKNSFCFTRPTPELHARINTRVDVMFQRGLVDESRELLKHGLAENKYALQAIGYRQVVEHLRGEHTLAETIELVKIRTRQFAKRQLTWFRRYGNCKWIELAAGESAEMVAEKI